MLAEDVFSKIDFPPFNQSNVDGYAIAFKDANEKLKINGESAAGNNEQIYHYNPNMQCAFLPAHLFLQMQIQL